ncbi:thioredoxin family protein [Gloeobacter kilaueensis]|uniref:Thiol:disulfide interchange protein n=1 Tax=Gloeobacter kilaueensis (strain ATCC BAA-2537 / CCAP 1431/1 / ULC 316 / JS1) TaxID=1183438 RepID=U5QE18_GLOK1|nr:thioredoxin family protein [Gloeobacter kilaueensis]AGY57207.1 thiol:disulfide interchange protein precursor [Gloeobacter kilaueensis JS1]
MNNRAFFRFAAHLFVLAGLIGLATSVMPVIQPVLAVEGQPYDETADAHKQITSALAAARQDGRYVLLDFGANWCPDCRVLGSYFENGPLKNLVDQRFHLVSIDVGRWNRNTDIAVQYGNPIKKGIPAVVVLDSQGKIVGSTAGGELANARTMTAQQVGNLLEAWAPKAR